MESPAKRSRESKRNRSVPDLNNMEHVNIQLKSKLKILTVDMKDAVIKMNSMTEEMNIIRNENLIYKDRLAELEQENTLLISQIEEMANERAERDAIIDEFSSAVEARIVEWKEILDEKDATITKLKENLIYITNNRQENGSPEEKNQVEIEQLIEDIDRRDEIIAELQAKLSEAVVEINGSSLLIEKFKSDSKIKNTTKRSSREQKEMEKKIQDANKKISTLESLLKSAERDAKVKSEQLCEALSLLSKYEDENTSLTEALDEIKDLKDQIERKNKYIEDLVDVTNRLEMENSRFEEAIIVLRDKLGIAEEEESSIEELILHRQQAQEKKIDEMRRNYDKLSSENIDLKFQIRQLKSTLKKSIKQKLIKTNGISSDGEQIEEISHRSESKKEFIELRRIKENVKCVIEENEALRQGMHEILDCIHHQDGKSIVTIQSQTLENLLEALDARHLAGWYHPAMRLQGRVNYLQGSNAELRTQLQQIRKNQLMLQIEMQQRASSVEEGECSQSQSLMQNNTLDGKMESPSYSRNVTPKSITSVLSQNADSGRASGKAADMDDMQQTDAYMDREQSQSIGDSPMEDEGFGKKSEEIYAMAKEIIAQESDFKNELNDAEKCKKVLESQITTLRKKLANSVSSDEYNKLREKYLESNMHLRAALEENFLTSGNADENQDIGATKNRLAQELRNELVSLHKQLSGFAINNNTEDTKANPQTIEEIESKTAELKAENERLQKAVEIAREEASIHRAIDSTVLTEFNELRQRILKFEMDEGQEIKETARLSLELANYKVIETELREQKRIMEGELVRAREELSQLKKKQFCDKEFDEQINKQSDSRELVEIIDFLQRQYASATSLSSWIRYESCLNKLNNERNEVKELIIQINDRNENLKIQQETLTNRLRVVEQLKDMLEQQIGSNDVQDIMQKFTTESRQALTESKYKIQINILEEAIKKAHANLSDYEAKIKTMESEMNKVQKAWKVQKTSTTKNFVTVDKITETDPVPKERISLKPTATKSVQTEINTRSIESQCIMCCKSGIDSYLKSQDETDKKCKETSENSEVEDIPEHEDDDPLEAANVALLQEQLGQALTLASERSVAMSKLEARVAEYSTKISALTKLLDEKNTVSTHHNYSEEPTKDQGSPNGREGASLEVLQSTINALEKIIDQKEETIKRYQNQLKEDRDKHNETTIRLHEEIRSLQNQNGLTGLLNSITDNTLNTDSEIPEKDSVAGTARTEGKKEEVLMLKEKITRMEIELNLSAELAERWHSLAEDRLRHMDSTRERLEEQHSEEIHSYRSELNQRQREVDELRRQMLELRRVPTTKTEVHSFIKALQIKDNKLADELETELEEHVSVERQRLSTTYNVEDSRICACEQLRCQADGLRRQVQVYKEREKSYKVEIAELQQKLSKRYMATRTQEKRASKRETQLEKKVKELEEELHETREILDRHYMVQQIKRAKTAEDLGLWEKCKKWQQAAEKLKEKLREKTEECQRLQSNYEKLRNLISLMEREKWYSRGKCRSESVTSVPVWLQSPNLQQQNNDALVEDLQRECRELRDRVTELIARLHCRENEKTPEKKKLASVAIEEEECTSTEVKHLKDSLEIIEKENLKLEAENFELRLELERANVNTPRYEEKIQHLEKYIEILKSEIPIECNYVSSAPRRDGAQRTKLELERTVCTLRKLVKELQFENKKLRNSFDQVDNIGSECNCIYLREEYERAMERISTLEVDLELAQKKVALMEELSTEKYTDEDGSEVAILKQQLQRKSQQLIKVRDLHSKAALNEKALRQQIQQLEFKQTLSIIPECGTSLGMSYS